MQNTLVINAVGLTPAIIQQMPALKAWAAAGGQAAINPVVPAVTCTVQATYYTGLLPSDHGIVGNGWYSREEGEVKFWKQSNRLVQGPPLWETARQRNPAFTCANLFWWYNMNTTADFVATPRPQYLADGRKAPDIYTLPAALRDELQQQLGTFPLFDFWGPRSGIRSSAWIAAATKLVMDQHRPTLTLCYLPHLDYDFQRLGHTDPAIAKAVKELDDVLKDLIAHAEKQGYEVVVLSEYGITDVNEPIFINRALRKANMIYVREERGGEYFDPQGSAAFAVCDHQIAHVYINDLSKRSAVRAILEKEPGIARILEGDELITHGLAHPRSGDFVCLAKPNAWFAYYYWLDDARAPDYARMVDIHKKPGYDPVELFADPAIKMLPLVVGGKLIKKKLGFRTLMNIIPLDASLVKGSHGLPPQDSQHGPVFLTRRKDLLPGAVIEATAVHDLLLGVVGV